MNVTIWNEYEDYQKQGKIAEAYPQGLHSAIKSALNCSEDINIRYAFLSQPENGLSDEVLNNTDVLVWWGHRYHDNVAEDRAQAVARHVLCGMGIVFLHSAHMSKPFIKLMGTSCTLKWRDEGEKERLWIIDPSHPIAKGLPEYIEIKEEEMYGERFDIPAPDELVFIGWFKGGEVFRSGCAYKRGLGRVFYFQPGHETFPVYYQKEIREILLNAVKWAAPLKKTAELNCPNVKPLEI